VEENYLKINIQQLLPVNNPASGVLKPLIYHLIIFCVLFPEDLDPFMRQRSLRASQKIQEKIKMLQTDRGVRNTVMR